VKAVNAVNAVNAAEFARNCHCKTFLSLFLYVALLCIVRLHDQALFASLSTPSNDLGENILDIVAAMNISSFGMACHGINNLEFMGIPDKR
jgi:hypothetical protein